MRFVIVALTAAAFVVPVLECHAAEHVPASVSAVCAAQAHFYEDAIFSSRQQHQRAVDAAIRAKQPAASFEVEQAMSTTLSETPARGLGKDWRSNAIRAVYTQPQYIVLSPIKVGDQVYDDCIAAAVHQGRASAKRSGSDSGLVAELDARQVDR
jgi:hypothetical protein